jgi:hypothetical protein
VAQLERLGCECELGAWAFEVLDRLRELQATPIADTRRLAAIVSRLEWLADEQHPRLLPVAGPSVAANPAVAMARRTRHALARRVEVWQIALAAHQSVPRLDSMRLVADLERYERTGLPSAARKLAAGAADFESLPSPLAGRLESWFASRYRNANVRVSISEDFLNLLLPRIPPRETAVRDTLLGVPTRGSSLADTQLGIRLVPDRRRLRFDVLATGRITARTVSTSGPARLYTDSNSLYRARKAVTLDRGGLDALAAFVTAESSARLRRISTDLEDIPLVGLVVEEFVRAEYDENRARARREAERKIAAEVRSEFDTSFDNRMLRTENAAKELLLVPLARLGIPPEVLEMSTGSRRMAMRVRLASEGQLAAHTPRPYAPAACLASVQVHESAVNNALESSGVAGGTFTLSELTALLDEKLNRPARPAPERLRGDVRFTLARRDAVRVRFTEGKLELTLAFDQLSHDRMSWKDFTVRVTYRPESQGISPRFVRDGTISLRGERFGARPQVVLRGIFSKMFPPSSTFELLPARWGADARLAGLKVSQFVVTDGWVGVAWGRAERADRMSVAVGR